VSSGVAPLHPNEASDAQVDRKPFEEDFSWGIEEQRVSSHEA